MFASHATIEKSGKNSLLGFIINTFDPEPEAGYLMKQELGHGFQLVLNILNQRALPIIKTAGEEGYGIIVRMPLQFGLLTGKFNSESKFAINDHRHSRLTREVISKSSQALEPVWELCNKYKITKAQLALSYALSYQQVSTVIPGIRTPTHVEQNTDGLIRLDDDDLKMIESLGKTNFVPVLQLIREQG